MNANHRKDHSQTKHAHFEGKDVIAHLKKARQKGAAAMDEIHGTEASGSLSAAADSAKETAIVLIALTMALIPFSIAPKTAILTLALFSVSYLLWKVGRSALLGWHRLERLHRLIEQEQWEVKHHREQEREELRAMYEQKGFHGKLLDEVVEILMADDNRLLQIMLEEELGLRLESYEHPLQQAGAAGVGVLIAAAVGIGAFYLGSMIALTCSLAVVFIAATWLLTKRQGNQITRSVIWSAAIGTLALSFLYLLTQLAFQPQNQPTNAHIELTKTTEAL
ncbi:MAG: VIT1/CCC1 transporter family protein [Chlamydiota bacterium]